jgi:hypothetical protein
MEIWTMQLSKWRLAKNQGIEIVNITAKSGFRHFAPAFSKVMEYKQGLLTSTEYTQLYLEKMRKSFRFNPNEWEALLTKDKVAYACYCPDGVFCHRHIFVDILTLYLDKKEVDYTRMGELIPF